MTVVDCDGLGGASVLTDCVPSKTLIATAEVMTTFDSSYEELGIIVADDTAPWSRPPASSASTSARSTAGEARSRWPSPHDIAAPSPGRRARHARPRRLGGQQASTAPAGRGRAADGERDDPDADAVLVATGAHPRVLPDAEPDGERILNWTQVYDLDELPEQLIVVGSGVTGAEFAGAYQALGVAGDAGVLPRPGAARARTRTPPRCSRTSSGAAA